MSTNICVILEDTYQKMIFWYVSSKTTHVGTHLKIGETDAETPNVCCELGTLWSQVKRKATQAGIISGIIRKLHVPECYS